MSYYYLVSSLPSLTLNDRPEIALDAFRALCAGHLSPRDAGALESLLDVDSEDTPPHPFTQLWIARETQLRNAAARLRAAKRQEDAGTFLRDHTGFDTGLEYGVEEAFSLPDPMARERALDQIRWRILDELSGHDPFGPNVVLAYAVKLQLAERWGSMNQEQGQAKIGTAITPSGGKTPGNMIETQTTK
jgi:hypothetical protein